MFIELAEILICPACRSGSEDSLSGLVAVVDDLRDRRVMEGWLGCPACRARYSIRDGVVRFGPASASPFLEDPELGLRAAALLALHERPGYVLTGQGLESIGGELAGFAAEAEVVALSTGAAHPGVVSRLIGVVDDGLPFRPGTVTGAALLDAGPGSLDEAARVLRPAGRLVVFQPSRLSATGQVEAALRAAGLEPLAVEAEAVVAVRPA